ncbi:YgaP family membrane protein [Novosphingobium sp. NPDC080210]|uniref:YgaP family membrane protein n=1 Tax=unclassified Novosphingobium TaxID=2644732 RepID=UPI0035AF8E2F
MTRNVGQFDRTLRIVLGLVLLGMAVSGLYTPWTWLGVVPLLTGLIGWCPPYSLLGINTCKAR